MKRLQGVGLLAHTDELDRLAGELTHRQRRTTAGITVGLGEDHTGERQRFIKGLGGVGRILTGHGVHHEQGFHRADGPVQALDLAHHVFVDMQTARGIDDQHIHITTAGFFQRRIGNIHRVLVAGGREEVGLHFPRQGFQLLDSGRAVDVSGHHHDFLLLTLLQETRKLGHGGGFTGTLQARHQNNGRRLGGQIQGVVGIAHGVNQLVVDDLHKRLARVQALQHFLPQGLFLYLLDKLFHHRQGHIGLQQCLAHFAQGVADIVFGQGTLTCQAFKRRSQPIGEILEHGSTSKCTMSAAGRACRSDRGAIIALLGHQRHGPRPQSSLSRHKMRMIVDR